MTAEILIVDDESSNRKTLGRLLSREGHGVLEAEDGQSALTILATNSPKLMIADLMMPGLSGIDLLKAAKKTNPNLEVIVMTAYGTVEAAVEAMKSGAWDFISKPLKRAELIRAVSRALEKHSLSSENRALKAALARAVPEDWVANSQAMHALTEEARQVADSEASIFLEGESGTGKSMLARWIHNRSPRRQAKFITLNCGAIPENLLESELFGHEAGAFTGAKQRRRGRFELAEGGTMFLDEVTEMSPQTQVKLLRVLQEGEFERVGGTHTIKANARIIAATNREPQKAIEEGRLRADLYYRLNVIPLNLPPLRDRPRDIPLLARRFAMRHSERNRRPLKEISEAAITALSAYNWPGNVRELENAIERAVVLCKGSQIEVENLPLSLQNHQPNIGELKFVAGTPLKNIERAVIEATLRLVDGDKLRAAEILGITARTIYRREAEWRDE